MPAAFMLYTPATHYTSSIYHHHPPPASPSVMKDTIHALASMPSAPRLMEAAQHHQQHQCQQDHACMHCEYAKLSAKTKQWHCAQLHVSLSFQKSHETNLATIVLPPSVMLCVNTRISSDIITTTHPPPTSPSFS